MIRNETVIEGELYALAPRGADLSGFEAVDGVVARAMIVQWFRGEPCRALDLLAGTARFGRVDAIDERALDEALWRLHETYGDLVLGVRKRISAEVALGPIEGTVPLQDLAEEKEPDAEHWIEIRVEDDGRTPVCHERYELILPDGRVEHGTTDDQGGIYVDGIQKAGNCRVVLPGLVLELPPAA